MRHLYAALATMLLIGGCSSSESDAPATTSPPETAVTTTSTTTTVPTTTTVATTTTSAASELTVAQEIYCEELTSVVAVRTATGGVPTRPETIAFMEIADRLGYLNLPYVGRSTVEQFILLARGNAGALNLDVGDALRLEWELNLGDDVPFETAFAETCLVAWELK